MRKIHKCGHGWRNTIWRAADWRPTFLYGSDHTWQFTGILPQDFSLCQKRNCYQTSQALETNFPDGEYFELWIHSLFILIIYWISCLYITYKVLLYVSAYGFQFSVLSKSPPEVALINLLQVFCSAEASVKIVTNGLKCVTLSVLFSFLRTRALGKRG